VGILTKWCRGGVFLFVLTDDENSNSDSNTGNNVGQVTISTNGQSEKTSIAIHAPPPPDLLITSFNAPASGIAGQPIDLTFTITNRGDSTTVPNNWRESVYLAADAQGKTGRLPLGTKNTQASLAVGETYSDSITVSLPISAQGNYFLIMETDAGNRVFEGAMEGNNQVATGFNVIRPPASDLVVDQIFGPDSAYAGESIQIQWAVTNIGANPGQGVMQDAVYLSKDTRLSDDDLRLGVRTRSTNLAPLSIYTDSLTTRIGSLKEGNYFVLVATDVRNNIYESEETNNLRSSTTPIRISVTTLPLETLVSDSLFHQKEKYLKIDVPASLRGESLTLQLRSESTKAFNEAYIRYGEAATRTNYDFVYTSPFRKDQDVMIPELDTGAYYITLYANSENYVDQAITLFADVLEFELRDINAKQGGNTGRVTVKIEGSKFEQGIRARLEKDGQHLEAASVFRRDPTVIFATFNLSGASLGLYDVVLENLDGETVSRETAFAVVEGSAGVTVATGGRSAEGEGNICCVYATGTDNILDVEIEHPSAVRPNRIYDIIIEFTNTGNIDLPVPNRMLVSLDGAPIAFNSSDLEKGLLELFLEYEEDSGPFKTFRPGATKKFIIYTLSTPQGLNRRTRGVRIRFRLIE
jgi:uncharacterized protein (DUF2141 family)